MAASAVSSADSIILAAVLLGIVSIYGYVLYNVPDAPRPQASDILPSNATSLLSHLTHPISFILPHIHVPFLPLAYLLSLLYTVFYPIIVVLRTLAYIAYAPIAALVAVGKALYPLYVLCGVAAVVGLAIGGGYAAVARLVWFIAGNH